MYVIVVNKSEEFLLNVGRCRHLHIDGLYFFHDNARDSTLMTSRCFFADVVHYVSKSFFKSTIRPIC